MAAAVPAREGSSGFSCCTVCRSCRCCAMQNGRRTRSAGDAAGTRERCSDMQHSESETTMGDAVTQPEFSIVVPACNVGRYAKDMIASIRNQTDPDFEALLVVEESTDGTLEICRAETAGDARFRVISLPRSGSASNSRNYGIRHAAGKYLVFLDGDDWIEPESIGRFREAVREYGELDILFACGSEYGERPDGGCRYLGRFLNLDGADAGKIMTGNEAAVRVLRAGRLPSVCVCLSVYRREFLLEHALFQVPGMRHEDLEWVPRVWYFAERTAVLDYSFVNYRKHAGSVTTSLIPQSIHDIAAALDALFDFWFSHDASGELRRVWASHWLSVFFWYFYHPQYIVKFPEKDRREAFFEFFNRQGHRCREVARHAPRAKRLATPLLLLAWKTGWEYPVRCYFRYLYYPLIALKGKAAGK
ncbi:glycosyltransferase family 2 protein [Victivallaceae bacterium BBE-744-WT-12]|uniref:Glycosyltransferase family 2 protein n=3 Tax=Victivallis lenta TaxID=2606640 RepID=A0A844G2F6_9BACT|nr:hypothetical protein C5Q97_19255 [Victivallales bacterium CCUG 44730]MST97343.1 glycosyltransferase family 2 protein [Victivallis lenta]